MTCARCGRKGAKAFRPHTEVLAGRTIRLHVCSNTGACGMRQARDLANDGLVRCIEQRLTALRETP